MTHAPNNAPLCAGDPPRSYPTNIRAYMRSAYHTATRITPTHGISFPPSLLHARSHSELVDCAQPASSDAPARPTEHSDAQASSHSAAGQLAASESDSQGGFGAAPGPQSRHTRA